MCSRGSSSVRCATLFKYGEFLHEFCDVLPPLLDVCADGFKPCCVEDICRGGCEPGTVREGSDMHMRDVSSTVIMEGV